MSESEIVKVKFSTNGDLSTTQDGLTTLIAHYEKKTGILEFTTKENSVSFYTQVISRISTINNGKHPSGNIIRTIRVKGDPDAVPLPKNAPPRPKLGPLGDSAKEYVAWMLKYDLPQAIVRYGIYTDENGEPIKKEVQRVFEKLVDNRSRDDNRLVPRPTGNGQTKGPVDNELSTKEYEEGIIARRATELTFTPSEVVGGYSPEDDAYSNVNVEAYD